MRRGRRSELLTRYVVAGERLEQLDARRFARVVAQIEAIDAMEDLLNSDDARRMRLGRDTTAWCPRGEA